MSESIFSEQKHKDFLDLQVKAAKLRLQHIQSDKEFIESIGRECSEVERLDIDKRRRGILYQLELEGAKIEAEYIEKYRSRLLRVSRGWGGVEGPGGGVFEWCIICDKCVTAACLSCIACSSRVTWSAI